MNTWHWAILTHAGIYTGEIQGELEPGETPAEAQISAGNFLKMHFLPTFGELNILAVFVSASELHIDAPGTTLTVLNMSERFII